MKFSYFFVFIGSLFSLKTMAQNLGPNITGNTETTFQYLRNDSLIGADQPDEKSVINSYTYLNYSYKNIRAGVRFESYLPHILGYPDRYSGTGIGYRYAGYYGDKVDITVGNFYEQFGSGMIFRSYEQRALGIDNAMDGLQLKFRPYDGVEIKTVYGKMRYAFTDGQLVDSDGLVRGIDAQVDLNSAIKSLASSKIRINFGGSFVSKYQEVSDPTYNYPNNVGAYSARFKADYKNFYLEGEYAIKEQDPSADNNEIYNYGHGALINAGYSTKGFGMILSAKSIDNMSYRVDPSATLTDLNINFLPALTKSHTYNLAATLYPYSTQPQGEVAFMADIYYKIPKHTLLGGKYGTSINVNYSLTLNPMRHQTGVDSLQRIMYVTRPFDPSDSLLNSDFNIEIKRKINKKLKMTVKYFNFIYNNNLFDVTTDDSQTDNGYIRSHIGVIETQYKISRKHSVRMELQGLFSKQDRGNWGTLLIEYNISPHWFFAVLDQYNYGNPQESQQLHYLIGSAGYTFNASRIMMTYGRQKEGIFCVGGVCRPVPATNGLTVTFTSSF